MGMGQMSYTVWLKFRQLLDTCPQIPQVDLIDDERMFHDHSGELMVYIVTYKYIYIYICVYWFKGSSLCTRGIGQNMSKCKI
jgi:hypothetical protein